MACFRGRHGDDGERMGGRPWEVGKGTKCVFFFFFSSVWLRHLRTISCRVLFFQRGELTSNVWLVILC